MLEILLLNSVVKGESHSSITTNNLESKVPG